MDHRRELSYPYILLLNVLFHHSQNPLGPSSVHTPFAPTGKYWLSPTDPSEYISSPPLAGPVTPWPTYVCMSGEEALRGFCIILKPREASAILQAISESIERFSQMSQKSQGSSFFSNRIWPYSRFAGFECSAFSGALPSVWLSPKPDPQLFLLSAVGDEILSGCFHYPFIVFVQFMNGVHLEPFNPSFPSAHCQCFTSHHGIPVHFLWTLILLEHAKDCTLSTTSSRPHCQPAGQWSSFKIPFQSLLPQTTPGTSCLTFGSLGNRLI